MQPQLATPMSADGDIAAVAWHGCAIDAATCAACAHAALRAQGGCEPGRCCMQDAYAQRIDAASLPDLLSDSDYQVRCIVATRLPAHLLPLLMHDADLQVRLAVAQRIPMPALWRMAGDGAPEVRRVVAQRLPASLLEALAGDADWRVRWEVAGQARGKTLQRLLADPESDVRERAEESAAESAAAGRDRLQIAQSGHV